MHYLSVIPGCTAGAGAATGHRRVCAGILTVGETVKEHLGQLLPHP